LAGYALRLYGSFEVGDVIEIEGKMGRVKDLTPLKTVIETAHHSTYSIPNSKVMQSNLYNFTKYKSGYPVELEFEIPKQADYQKIKLEILEIVAAYPMLNVEKPVNLHIKHFTDRGILLRTFFFVSDFRIVQGAKNFVAGEILERSKSGKIPLLNSHCDPERFTPHNPIGFGRQDSGERDYE
jgi:small-conductance mechanosensitive channel